MPARDVVIQGLTSSCCLLIREHFCLPFGFPPAENTNATNTEINNTPVNRHVFRMDIALVLFFVESREAFPFRPSEAQVIDVNWRRSEYILAAAAGSISIESSGRVWSSNNK